jgi:hypothetical protein
MRHNLQDWLEEVDNPSPPTPDLMGQNPNMGQNPAGGNETNPTGVPPQQGQTDPSITNQPQDVTNDPSSPDMPEEKDDQFNDFEVWKNSFFKESIKGNAANLLNMLNDVRHKEGLHSYQRKFVKDNWDIALLRQDANIDNVSKNVRKLLRDQLDRNNPSTSVINHLLTSLQAHPILNNVFIKLLGYGGQKGDLHRKFIASLIGAVQVGSGANNEDIIFNEQHFSIMISTRFNARWGDVILGDWSLKEDDATRYLAAPEQKRLQGGSPEEKDVLRKRVVIESIAKQFETRSFIINVALDDGTIGFFGLDLSNAIKGAYSDGKITIKTKKSDNSEAMIDVNGNIVPLVDITLYYSKETGNQTIDGEPETEEVEFMERRNGTLYLTASYQTIKDCSSVFQGTLLKEIPWNGNISDLSALKSCVYSSYELLMKQC